MSVRDRMKAAVLASAGKISDRPLRIEDVPQPETGLGQVLLRVQACGVCRTDLHIVEGELPALLSPLIPGHQIVGEIVDDGLYKENEDAQDEESWTNDAIWIPDDGDEMRQFENGV